MSSWYIERRKWPRFEINAPAKIVMITHGLRVKKEITCTVLDISEGGAQLLATAPIECEEFYLETDASPGASRLCSVVRRVSDSRVGVKFV
jgi:c-di-GMP-binding flagellar brake protein YcgR